VYTEGKSLRQFVEHVYSRFGKPRQGPRVAKLLLVLDQLNITKGLETIPALKLSIKENFPNSKVDLLSDMEIIRIMNLSYINLASSDFKTYSIAFTKTFTEMAKVMFSSEVLMKSEEV